MCQATSEHKGHLTVKRAEAVSPRTKAALPARMQAPAAQATSRCHTGSAWQGNLAKRVHLLRKPDRQLQRGEQAARQGYCITVKSEAAHLHRDRGKVSHL